MFASETSPVAATGASNTNNIGARVLNLPRRGSARTRARVLSAPPRARPLTPRAHPSAALNESGDIGPHFVRGSVRGPNATRSPVGVVASGAV